MPSIDPKSITWDAIDPNGIKWDSEGDKPQVKPITRTDKVLKGMRDPIDGGAQLLTHLLPTSVVDAGNRLNNWLADNTGLVAKIPEKNLTSLVLGKQGGLDQLIQEGEQQYQAQRAAAGESGFDGWRATGNAISPVNIGLGRLLPTGATTAAKVALGGVAGATSGALSPVTDGGDFAAEKGKQIGAGAIGGSLAAPIASGIGRLISPKASVNPDLKLLKDAGVKPTVGQSLGGAANAIEEKLQSVPIMGDAISGARRRALESFNQAAINRATGPVGVKVEGAGQDAIRQAGDAVSKAYDDALGSVSHVTFDAQHVADMGQLRGMAQNLVPELRKKFNATMRDLVDAKTSPAGAMLPDTFKKVDSELGQLAARWGKSSTASEQELGDAFRQAQALLRENVARQNPEFAAALKDANAGYANLVRIEGAAKAAKNNNGVFTPAQLNTAIQAADTSVRKRAVSRGEALMQDLSTAGQNVIGNKIPNSGTADRAMVAAGAMGSGLYSPWIPAGLVGGAAAYTSPVQNALRAAVSSRPESAQAVAEALKQSSPALASLPAQTLIQLLTR